MLKYILKRVLIFVPTLFAISLLTFIISLNAPGDPVDMMLNQSNSGQGQSAQKLATEKAYISLKHKLGLDLPIFYFSFSNASLPDTMYRIVKAQHRYALERMCDEYGNWESISAYYLTVRNLDMSLYSVPKDSSIALDLQRSKDFAASLLETYDQLKTNVILSNLEYIFSNTPAFASLNVYLQAARSSYEEIQKNKSSYRKYIPRLQFYGFNNQYHNWIVNFIHGDFGISYQDKRPVASVIWDAVRWTMLISSLSILLSYIVSIPVGVKSAVKKGTRSDRVTTTGLFMLYSMPPFWIATMLIMFFCGGDYFDWFPAFGLGTLPDDAPLMQRLTDTSYHLILPLFCWTYTSFAFLSRQMRGGVLNVIGQDYIRTARAKGVPEKQVVWRHAFRNSLLPIITMFANIFPLVISGSFIIEWIFSIPGMGKITLEALIARNYPIVFTEMMFAAILTLIGTLVADILYAAVDPRISFSGKSV